MTLRAAIGIGTLLAISGAESAWPQTEAIRREGAFWVQTLAHSETLGSATQLRVEAIGNIVLKGAGANGLDYRLVRRVRARDEAEARRRLRSIEIGYIVRGSEAVLDVSGAPETELQLNAPQTLRVVSLNTRAGNLDVTGFNGAVQLRTGAGKVSVHGVKGDLSIETAGGLTSVGDVGGIVQIDSGGGSIHAEVLRGSAVLQTAGGDIVVQSVAGAIRAFTAGGGIRIRNAGAAVNVTTAGGPIEVMSARGTVTARNAGGPIQVGSSHGAVCESQSGMVRLDDISGPVRVETFGGSVVARLLSGHALEASSISTAGGDITVFLPSDARLTLRAESERPGDARSIVSDFPGFAVHAGSDSVRGEGQLNGGGPLLRLAGNGLILIKRR
jgi:DUF4097 and DUF4098 domain-containing protein YvlB